MRPAGFTTTVGSTGASREGRDVVVTYEPEVGATLRTRGRAYLLCEVDPPSQRGRDIAAEVVEIARHEYYYDLSAGVEVGLRRALRKANRHAAQQLRELRGRVALHAACAVIVNNELYAARIGAAHVFLVRHARLFLPGDEPNELADFVHRTTTRQASSLGAEPDLLPQVWRQRIEAGDTIILASGSLVERLGADALKSAAITLHPRAAAESVRDRAVAEEVSGSHATIFLEIAASSGAASRLGSAPEARADEVAIAENIRAKLDPVWRRRPRLGAALSAITVPVSNALGRAIAVALELMPRSRPELPRRPESARTRSRRLQRITSLLAVALLLVTAGIGAAVINDYQENQVINDFRIAVVGVETDIASARSFFLREDRTRAFERLDAAAARLDDAAESPAADEVRVAELRAEISLVSDRLNNVILDLATVAPGSAPVGLTQTPHGLYAADPGAGRLWRIFGEDPVTAAAVLERGREGVGTPLDVVAQEEALIAIDDARAVWRAEGNTVARLELPGTETWKGVTDIATFVGNVYILDGPSGQLWRYEPDLRGVLLGPVAFLPEPLAADSAKAVAVDGDIWILTGDGAVQRYRRQGIDPVLTRLPFEPRWTGAAPRATSLQAIDSQRFIWLLDSATRILVQVGRDGREIDRFQLPERLPAPAALFVSEGQQIAYTIHGSKVVATSIAR